MKKGLVISLLSVLMVLALCTIAMAGNNIHFSLSPGTFEGEVGETITVPVAIQSYPDGFSSSIITFGLIVNYDPTYLSVEGVSTGLLGEALDFDSNYSLDPANFDQQKGQVVISYSTTGAGLSQMGDFYNLSFKLKAKPSSGTTNINLALRTTPDGTPFDSAYQSYTAACTGAVITITEQDLIPPVLSNVTTGSFTVGTTIAATTNEDGFIYLVPAATAANKDAVQTAAQGTNGATQAAVAGVPVQLTSIGFAPGSYLVYAVDVAGNLSAPSQIISLTEVIADDKIHFQVNPAPIYARVGDTIEVPVAIRSLPEGFASAIITFGIDLNYDPLYFKVVGVNTGGIGEAADFDSGYSLDPDGFDHTIGKLTISYSTAGEGISQSGTFYNVFFQVLATPEAGSTVISLARRVHPDGTAFDSQQNPCESAYHDGTIFIEEASSDECFIATACFGSKYEPSVVLLRQFRDQYLLSNSMGQALVKYYYRTSPPIADTIAGSASLKAIVRGILTPVVGVVYLVYHPQLVYPLIAILIAVVLIWQQRRRKTRFQ